jgi:hypothetical protein
MKVKLWLLGIATVFLPIKELTPRPARRVDALRPEHGPTMNTSRLATVGKTNHNGGVCRDHFQRPNS